MKYAVLQSGGKQYKVTEGSVIEVEHIKAEQGSEFVLNDVLMVADDGAFTVGQPILENVSITATVLEQKRGKKIRVAKFKAKARHRRVMGHRQELTKLQIVTIGDSTAKPRRNAAAAETTKDAEVITEKKTVTAKKLQVRPKLPA